MEAAWKASNETYAELNASNPRWKKIYEDYARFRDNQVRWFRVTEDPFTNFMSSVAVSSPTSQEFEALLCQGFVI